MNKPLLDVLGGKTLDTPPVWLMRQAGRYLPEYREIRAGAGTFLDLCYNPELASEVSLQPIHRFGMDGTILFADLLLIPDALGQKVEFLTGEGPVLEPVTSGEAIDGLSLDSLHSHLAPVYETVRRLRQQIPAHSALIGFAGAPWTVASYMIHGKGSRDHAEAKTWAYRNPDLFRRLLDLLVESTAQYLAAQIEAGAEAVQIFDSWASALPDWAFHEWCIEPTLRIIERLRERSPDTPIIGFPRGVGLLYLDYVKATRVDAVSVDTGLPARWAAENLQPLAAVQGNLDPAILLAGGELLDREVRRLVETLGGGPHIFNLGHGVIKETPPEHVGRVVDVIRGNA